MLLIRKPMSQASRIIATLFILGATSIAWWVLGSITEKRENTTDGGLGAEVDSLWGTEQTQKPPDLHFRWQTQRRELTERTEEKKQIKEWRTVVDSFDKSVTPQQSQITADLGSDLRRKGLRWYSLYRVQFQGNWNYKHSEPNDGFLDLRFAFPDPTGMYDDFHFVVDGVDHAPTLTPSEGVVSLSVPVTIGQTLAVAVSYKSRGRDRWTFAPGQGVTLIRDFALSVTTDFDDLDFPADGMSPSKKQRIGSGWKLDWNFTNTISGRTLAVVTPQRRQPGELAAELSNSAPISLLFFFGVMYVLSLLRNIDIHPVNYMMLAAAFFAFHLLFAYTADRLPVETAFILASTVSVFLVVSYLRLVISARFAFIEAALAQLVYLVGFSLAHFWKGFTGLTVTALAIATLFLVMQITGRIRWSQVFLRSKVP
jgi:Inner membrane protein CreD